MVQKYLPALAVRDATGTMHSARPNKAQEKPETRATPVANDTKPEPTSSSSVTAPGKRVAGTVDDSEMEDGHTENKLDRTIVLMEVCAQGDTHDEWLDELGQMPEDQRTVKKAMPRKRA